MKKPKSDLPKDQHVIDNRQMRLAVRRYYATAVDPTKIVDGLPKTRGGTVTHLDEAA